MQGLMSMVSTLFIGRAQQQQVQQQIDRIGELERWIAYRDELHRRMDADRVVAGAALRQHQRALARIEETRRELAAHMERKPR